jgi:glyoxylase-like metal-dependent hydrolase (beta-lactamase superfamily II)
LELVKLDNLTVFIGHKGGRYPSANSVLVEDQMRLLVDPSVDLAEVGRDAVAGRVDMIVNSHAHEDHFAGNYLFPEAPLIVHEKDAPCMQSLQCLMDSYGMDISEKDQWESFFIEQFHYTPRADLRPIRGGEVLDLGRTKVHCIHAPGHTPGHTVLRFEPQDVLFVGDLDLTAFGPYYGDVCSSLDETIASLDKLRAMAHGARACITSHQAGIVRDDIDGAIERYLNVLWEREAKLLAFIAEPRTLDEIAQRCIVYGKKYDHIFWQLTAEKAMMGLHLKRLRAQGRVEIENDGRFRASLSRALS